MGRINVSYDDIDICVESFGGKIKRIDLLTKRDQADQDEPVLQKAKDQIIEYLSGKRKYFDLPYDKDQGDFREKVYDIINKIPYGETMTYGQVAAELGNKSMARAVGNALGNNILPLIIPCHRITAANNKLGGFGGGEHLKKWLLELEERNS